MSGKQDPSRRKPFRSLLGGATLMVAAVVAVVLIVALFAAALLGGVQLSSSLVQTAWGIFILTLGVSGYLIQVGRRLMTKRAEAVMASDPRPPAVYLRPFHEDSRRTFELPIGFRSGGAPVVNPSKPVALDKDLARALARIAPLVGAGRPGERLAPLGAARFYVPHDDWKDRIDDLLRRAAVVVLQPADSEGMRWELERALEIVERRRLLILVPNPRLRPLGYAKVLQVSDPYLAKPLPRDPTFDTDAFMFDRNGAPRSLSFSKGVGAGLEPFLAQLASPLALVRDASS